MRVGVSGMNATDNPGPGIPVVRSLREAKAANYMVGLSYDAHDPGNYMDFLIDRVYRMPYPTKGWNALSEALTQVKKESDIDAIIPCLDVELPLYIKHQEQLRQLGIKTFLPTEDQFALRSKEKLIHLCQDLDISYPETTLINSIEELDDFVRAGNDWPIFVKGRYYKAYIAYNMAEAVHKFTEIATEWGLPILLQKPINGIEVNLVGLGDGEGGLCGSVAIKKLTTTSLGKIWTGVTIEHPALNELATRFVKRTRWRGPFELECIQTTAVGVNLPERLLRLMQSQAVDPTAQYPVGKYFVRYTYEMVTDISQFFRFASTV